MFKKFPFLAITVAATLVSSTLYAQQQEPEPEQVVTEEVKKNIIYERPVMKTLSQLYWALGKFEPEDDSAVDNFLRINECDLYKDYSQNEFEWTGVREAAREFVVSSKGEFPLHFEFVQPIQFAEYDLEKKEFDVWKPNKIDAVRRFEVLAEDIFEEICGVPYGGKGIENYPRGMLVEINRPFTLDKIAVDPAMARAFVEKKAEEVNEQGLVTRNKQELYESRDAVLVMKIRVFSYKEDIRFREYQLARVLGVLEGYEIYGDSDREMLMISENFRRKKQRSAMEVEMKKRYQQRLKQQMEAKRKAAIEASEESSTE